MITKRILPPVMLALLASVAPVALACSSVVADRLDVLQGGSGWLAVGTGGKDQ